jgi:hypothetical protein
MTSTNLPTIAYYSVQPSSQTAEAGSNVTFSYTLVLENSDYNEPTANVWQQSSDGGVTWTELIKIIPPNNTPIISDSSYGDYNVQFNRTFPSTGVIQGSLVLNSVTPALNGRRFRIATTDVRQSENYQVVSNAATLTVIS